MSERLPVVSGRQTVRVLERLGSRRISQRGSHVKLRNPDGRTVIVPLHDELARGTLRSILRQADLSPEDFIDAL
ncbi:MAG: type II toxin-antitoxin system HicA family toxin [Actinomycetota bacterium]|nr:type II toxin-antitoxin system HicA family toxin [Actinomycetota bacterium]